MSKESLFRAMGINTRSRRTTVDVKSRFSALKEISKVLNSEKARRLDNTIFTVGVVTSASYICHLVGGMGLFDWPYSKFGLATIPLIGLTGSVLWWAFKKGVTDFVYLGKMLGVTMFFITIPISGLLTLWSTVEHGGTVGYNLVMIPLSINYTNDVVAGVKLFLLVMIAAGVYILKPVMRSMFRLLVHTLYSVDDLLSDGLDLDKMLDEVNASQQQVPRIPQKQPREPKVMVDAKFKEVLDESKAEGAEIVKVNKGHRLVEYFVKLPPDITPSHFNADRLLTMRSGMGASDMLFSNIVEGMPKTVSFVIPRSDPESVDYAAGLRSDAFVNCDCELPMFMGANTNRDIIVLDLAAMPHVLVAGESGAGKSKLLVAMLLSMMQTIPAEQLEVIIIDPKQIELVQFNGVLHLHGKEVVTEPEEAEEELRQAVEIMNERYTLMKERSILLGISIKNTVAYNESVKGTDIPILRKIVIIVDEYGDLTMSCNKDNLEKYVARLGQKARAAGIHVVILTQRPTVDVITGVIKANLACRIALQVNAGVDSKTILDCTGAENLLGKGDMFIKHKSLGSGLTRVYGPWIDDEMEDSILAQLKNTVR